VSPDLRLVAPGGPAAADARAHRERRRNVDFYTDDAGRRRPIRDSAGYREWLTNSPRGERERAALAATLAGQRARRRGRNPPAARLVRTRPVRYLGRSTAFMELVVPGQKGAVRRVPFDPTRRGAADSAARRLREEARDAGIALRNLDGYTDAGGVIHPIRGSRGYDETYVRREREERREGGESAADRQQARSFGRFVEREDRVTRARDRVDRLVQERDGLREYLREDPAAPYTPLLGTHGKARSESGLIPLAVARDYLPHPPGGYRTAKVVRDGRTYIRREYALDQLADQLGYANDQELESALHRAAADKERLATLDREVRALRARERPKGRRKRRNPGAPGPDWAALGILGALALLLLYLATRPTTPAPAS